MNHEEYLTDYMLNNALVQRKESAAAKLNPFNVVMEDNNKAQNRLTSNFGQKLPVNNAAVAANN